MASPSVIQTREGEWTSEKYWNVLGVNIPDIFTNDPALLADYIVYFDTRADDVFVVSYPKSGSFIIIIILYTDNLRVSATTVRVEFKRPFLEVDQVLMTNERPFIKLSGCTKAEFYILGKFDFDFICINSTSRPCLFIVESP